MGTLRVGPIMAEFAARTASDTDVLARFARMSASRRKTALTALTPMNLLLSCLRLARVASLGALMSVAAAALADEPSPGTALPDDPVASTQVPDGTTTITQTREQNAVTSVRVQRGGNVYHVTPAEQIPYYQEGGRAATWEIFQFRSGSSSDRNPSMPPPQR